MIVVKQVTLAAAVELHAVHQGRPTLWRPNRLENEFETVTAELKRLIFIAGGIGITPIRATILHRLRARKPGSCFITSTRTPDTDGVRDGVRGTPASQGKVVLGHDNGDPDQADDLWPVLEQQRGADLYPAGRAAWTDAVRDMTRHRPDSAWISEDFVGVSRPTPTTSSEMKLEKTGVAYEVAANASILDTPRQHGHVLPSSCESGTCGAPVDATIPMARRTIATSGCR